MNGQHWLEDVRRRYARHKRNTEDAAAQVDDAAFFQELGGNPNSIAVLMKHVGGNLHSRWRDFLTTDGEKRDRDREGEFNADGETRASVLDHWNRGWETALAELARIEPSDLERTVTVRGQPLSVVEAIHRNLDHVAYHTGQVVGLARSLLGSAWRTQSIAPGESDAHNTRMRERHGDWWDDPQGA